MAVESGSSEVQVVVGEERVDVAPVPAIKKKRNMFPKLRIEGGRVKDPKDGKTCHQCRQKTRDFVAACTKIRDDKTSSKCPLMFCHRCLANRYGEKASEAVASGNWCCPRCKGICNCSICMKKKGLQPTGLLVKRGKADGHQSISAMLRNNGDTNGASTQKGNETNECGTSGSSKDIKMKMSSENDEDTVMEDASNVVEYQIEDLYAEFPLPVGSGLESVCGIEVHTKDVGNALQFLEFCAAFREVLEVNEGEPQLILQDLLHDRTAGRGISLTVQFHIDLLSMLLPEEEEEVRKESWFLTLKEILSESQTVLEYNGLDGLGNIDDYEDLDASQKLALLTVLCDEVLETEELHDWIDAQTEELSDKVKKAKEEVSAAKSEVKDLKQKRRDVIEQARIAHADGLSISEYEAVISGYKLDVEAAQAKMLEARGIISKNGGGAVGPRIAPLFLGDGGHAYWRLDSVGEADVLHQDMGQEGGGTSDDKWFVIDEEGKKALERHMSALKKMKRKKRKRRC